MGRMDEDEPLPGEIVKAPPLADIRYEDEDAGKVARVLVRVDYADGRIREYEALEPEEFDMNDPETDVSAAPTGVSVLAPGWRLAVPMVAMVPSLRLSFRANPRHQMHIRTERTAEPRWRR
jgi:hypothetical protein